MPTIRPYTESDLNAVVEIERASFSQPWPPEAFSVKDFGAYYVLEDGLELAGFILYHVVLEEAMIINFAVAPEHRRKGYGTKLLSETLELMRARGVHRIFLDVRLSNHEAQSLYRKFGFAELATRAKYYSAPEEDALVMVLHMGEQSQ